MINLSHAQIAVISAFLLSIGITVASNIPDNLYYCSSRDMPLRCNSLSSTTKTCYISDSTGNAVGRRCLEGWVHITEIPNETKRLPSLKSYPTSYDSCVINTVVSGISNLQEVMKICGNG